MGHGPNTMMIVLWHVFQIYNEETLALKTDLVLKNN